MKPLLYLTLKQLKNRIVRATGSPKRIIGLLLFLGNYLFIFGRQTFQWGMPHGPSAFPSAFPKFDFPGIPLIEAVVFAPLAGLSILMMLGATNQQAAFKPADVDVLFPTPISPHIVLVFRMLRDYFITLLFPLFFLIIGIQPVRLGWDAIFRNAPDSAFSGIAIRGLAVGWILMALCWITLSYAISLFINRSDKTSDRNKNLLAWGIVALILAIGAYVYFGLREVDSLEKAIQFVLAPATRTIFFTATFATQLVIAPLTGNWWLALGGLSALLAIIAGSIRVAMSQVGWIYDQAAVRGFGSHEIAEMRRAGDMMGMSRMRAQSGKLRARGAKSFVARLRMPGPLALIWKEYFNMLRGMLGMILGMFSINLLILLMPLALPDRSVQNPAAHEMIGRVFLYMSQGMGLMVITMPLAQVGFIETVRRVDLLKALPFTSFSFCIAESSARALVGIASSFIGCLIGVLIRPDLWNDALAAFLMVVGLSSLMSAFVFLITILFPDIDDQTQRQFRGLVTVLGVFAAGAPPVGLFIGLLVLAHAPPALAGLVACLVALGMSVGACAIAGRLYENLNPSE